MFKLPRLLVLAASLLIAPAAFAGPNHHAQQPAYGHAKGYGQKQAYGHAKGYGHGKHTPQVVVRQRRPHVVVHQPTPHVVVHQPAPHVVVQPQYGHGYSHRYRAAAWGYAPAPAVVVAPRLSWCDGEVSRVIVQMHRHYGVGSRLAVLRHAMATHDGWLDGRDLVRLADAIGPRRGVRDLVATVRPILRPMHPAQMTALLARTHPAHRDEVFAMLGGQTAWHPHHGPTVAQGW